MKTWIKDLLDDTGRGFLATLSENVPHIVPVVFVRHDNEISCPIDGKPKSKQVLRRVKNLEANSHAALMLDNYSDDWEKLWWLRLDCRASVETMSPKVAELLKRKYEGYEVYDVGTSVITLMCHNCSFWSMSGTRPGQ